MVGVCDIPKAQGKFSTHCHFSNCWSRQIIRSLLETVNNALLDSMGRSLDRAENKNTPPPKKKLAKWRSCLWTWNHCIRLRRLPFLIPIFLNILHEICFPTLKSFMAIIPHSGKTYFFLEFCAMFSPRSQCKNTAGFYHFCGFPCERQLEIEFAFWLLKISDGK